MTYKKDGHYIDDQGDYKTVGKFTVDNNNNLIKEFEDNGELGDTSTFQIAHLDAKFLLVVKLDKDPYSYFYKRR